MSLSHWRFTTVATFRKISPAILFATAWAPTSSSIGPAQKLSTQENRSDYPALTEGTDLRKKPDPSVTPPPDVSFILCALFPSLHVSEEAFFLCQRSKRCEARWSFLSSPRTWKTGNIFSPPPPPAPPFSAWAGIFIPEAPLSLPSGEILFSRLVNETIVLWPQDWGKTRPFDLFDGLYGTPIVFIPQVNSYLCPEAPPRTQIRLHAGIFRR